MSSPAEDRSHGPFLVAGATALLLALYFLLDGRPPRDPGLYWADVPRMSRALGGHRWDMMSPILARPGGWLVVVLAGISRVARGVWVFEAVSLISVTALVASAGRLGAWIARSSGPDGARWGGWVGALMVAGMPLVVVQGRLPWIHLPEAALLGLLLVILVEDPRLERRGAGLAAVLLGAALASVRHSGLVWLITTLPLLRGRAWFLVLPWAVGAVPSVLELWPYLMSKAGARANYASLLPGLPRQILWLVGAPGLAVLVLGLVGRWRHHRWDRTATAVMGMLGTVAAMWLTFRAGLDNFTPMALALVILAAGGVGRAATGIAGLGMIWVWGSTFVPGFETDSRSLYRVSPAHEVGLIRELVDRSCVHQPCRVGVVSGLFQPHGEEPGHLELWTLGMDGIFIIDLRNGARVLAEVPVAAVAQWDCGESERAWLERFPRSDEWRDYGRRALGLRPAWVYRPDNQCAFVWWTKDGALMGAEPSVGRRPQRR
ncbi:MAG: hypothetical protein CL927_13120 [Deltaproteobacteria bacterium]|nr:hypothetical protein [Deltaproteobacteria bacterium]